MQIANKTVVTIHYTLTDNDGGVLDSSDGDEPLTYLHGTGSIVTGLEKALDGKTAGDELKVTVAPADGYGERDEEMVQAVPRKNFPAGDIEVGMSFEAETEDGARVLNVVAVDADSVTVDGNHPLAGVTLNFAVTVVSVREPTHEELHHGHVHGEGGHHH